MASLEFKASVFISRKDVKDFIIHREINELKDFVNEDVQNDLIAFVCSYVYKDKISSEDSELIDQNTGNSPSLDLEVVATDVIAELTNRTYEEVYKAYELYCDSE